MELWEKGWDGPNFNLDADAIISKAGFEVLINQRDRRTRSKFFNICTNQDYPKLTKFTTVPTCQLNETLHGSEVSCSNLGFQNEEPNTIQKKIDHRYNSLLKICGASQMTKLSTKIKFPFISQLPSSCSGLINYHQAVQFCKNSGTRLCTFDELTTHQIVADTGCDGDTNRVWSSTRCSHENGSFLTAPGKRFEFPEHFPVRCTPESDVAIARCCADEQPPRCISFSDPAIYQEVPKTFESCLDGSSPTGTFLTCAELKFTYGSNQVVNSADANVCFKVILAEEEKFYNNSRSRCGVGKLDIIENARNYCNKVGARLCSSQEGFSLFQRNCAWTSPAWTSDSCEESGAIRISSVEPFSECTPSSKLTLGLVICCADEFGRHC